ncbi:hypothetical protein MMC18_004811 [Xylographa bjoerkii]|nr:hypothetical protein [Xylographa bjoerkii]
MTNNGQRFRDNLKSYGVTFNEDWCSDEHKIRLPSHVETVREQLLDITNVLRWGAVVDIRAKGEVEQALLKCLPEEQTNEIYFTGINNANARSTLGHRQYLVNSHYEDNGIQEHEINFINAIKIAEDARRLKFQDNVKESRFTRLLNRYVFHKWLQHGDEIEKYDPLDSVVSHSETTVLNHAHSARDQVHLTSLVSEDKTSPYPSRSKPDLFFAFPIHIDSDEAGSTSSRFYNQFSLTKLAHLQKSGLCSCPTVDLDQFLSEHKKRSPQVTDQQRESREGSRRSGENGPETAASEGSNGNENDERKLSDYRLLCFPWAIVELKPPDSAKADVLYCYCQTANGASSSLTLLEQLTKHRGKAHAQEPIPPILSLSFIGSEVKVWLAYTKISGVYDSWKNPCWRFVHHSTCIWEGSLKDTLDAVRLSRILDNALFWALRRFRPWVAHHLDAFYDRLQVDKPSFDLGDSVRKERYGDIKKYIREKRLELLKREQNIKQGEGNLGTREKKVREREEKLDERVGDVNEQEEEVSRRSNEAEEFEREVEEGKGKLNEREGRAEELERHLTEREKVLKIAEVEIEKKESEIHKREEALIKRETEREARNEERIIEYAAREIEIQHREEGLHNREEDTEALITRMYFDMLELQEQRAEARDSGLPIPDASLRSSVRDPESPGKFDRPRKELRQNKEGLKAFRAGHSDREKRSSNKGIASEGTATYMQPYAVSETSKEELQGSNVQTSAKDTSHQRDCSKVERSNVFRTPPSIRFGDAVSGSTTPPSLSDTLFSTASTTLTAEPVLSTTLFSGSPRSGPGIFDFSSRNSLSKARSTPNLFDSLSSGEDQKTYPVHDPFKSNNTDSKNTVDSKNFPVRSSLFQSGGRFAIRPRVSKRESDFTFNNTVSSSNHIQFFPTKNSGSATLSTIESLPTSFDFNPSLSTSPKILRTLYSPKPTAIRSVSPMFEGSGPSPLVDETRKSSKSPEN